MANNRWLGRQSVTAQVSSIQVTAYDVATTYKFFIPDTSGKFISTIAAGSVNATATALAAAWNASVEPEFAEVTALATTDTVSLTAKTAGKPFTVAKSVTGGTGTLGSVTAVTANTSPNDINDAVNWSNAAVPSTDNVYIDAQNVSLKWNLSSLSAVTATSITWLNSFTGDTGLAKLNTDSTQYTEYRTDYWLISATTVNVGDFNGTGSGRLKLNTGSVQTAVNVYATGSPSEPALPAFIWLGTHASNAVRVEGGSFGTSVFGGEVSTISILTVKGGSALLGAGTTLTTVNHDGGTIDSSSAISGVITQNGGTHTHRAGNIGTLTLNNGTVDLVNAAALTITNLTIGPGGTLDLSGASGAVTVTNAATLYPGATINDPGNVLLAGSFSYIAKGGPNSVTVTRGQASATVAIS